MKKVFSVVFISLMLVFNSFVLAESSHATVNINVVSATVESSLKNGFDQYKDLQTMFDNALSNGYDYCTVSPNQTATALMIDVAIDGLADALRTLDKSKSEEAKEILMQAKENVFYHCNAIFETCKMVGREDIAFMFKILDDESLRAYNDTTRDLVTIAFSGGEIRGIVTSIDAWGETPEKDAE